VEDLTGRAWKGLVSFVVVLWLMLFLPALTLAYWQAWLYWVVFSVSLVIISAYFLKSDPDLVERRMDVGPKAETERRQKIIQSLTSLALIVMLLVPGFDHRFGWSDVPVWLVVAGDGLVAAGFVVIFFVFKTNTYAAATIGVAEGQQVVSSGLYALVRHPMYFGAVLLFVGSPLALGSWWALLPAAGLIAALVWRLNDEERFLLENLPGYREYCGRVRQHLIPGLW
jgi:protein-S-isoprenylcysteine O-methyltransferase Ste14